MIEVAPRNSQKEFKIFENNIMWSREDTSMLWLCRDRRHKKSNIQRLFNWVDKKYILDVRMWHKSKNSIESIELKNHCGKIVKILFRLNRVKPQTSISIVDDLKDRFLDTMKDKLTQWELVGIDRAESNDIYYLNGEYIINKGDK